MALKPSVTGLCVGYELGNWRVADFADHIMEWLPEFVLTYSEIAGVNSANMVRLMRIAAKKTYETKKFSKRGEFGELLLHAAVRQIFDSLPAISKIYYKSATNDTVKGFDAVHVVGPPTDMELWIGEAKFYRSFSRAVKAVIKELHAHTKRDYLRTEFLLITGKIDPKWPHADELKKLLSEKTSLDEVFRRVRIPVFITYDSDCLDRHSSCSRLYCQDFEKEIREHRDLFEQSSPPSNLSIHLFLMPLKTKKALIIELDKRLRQWRGP